MPKKRWVNLWSAAISFNRSVWDQFCHHLRYDLTQESFFSTWIWRLQELWSDKNCPGNSKKKETLGDSLVWLVLLLLQPQSFLLPSRQLMGSHYLWYYSPTEETRHKARKVRNISRICLRDNFVFYETFVNSLSFLSELQIVLTQYLQVFLVSQMEPCKMQGFRRVIQFSFYCKKYRTCKLWKSKLAYKVETASIICS